MPATLSVACLTRDTTGRLAGILRLLRPLAAEIVVALDDTVAAEAAAALGDAADRVFAVPFRPPVERSLGWLNEQCSGDWVLRLDDDEVPSAALLRLLPALLEERGLSHCFFPRRWLWGSPSTYLATGPWVPDYQLRLTRNEPSLLWFPGVTHWPVEAVGSRRYLDAPIYHLDLLLNSRERREEKARSYEAAAPGRRIAGLPLNAAYYLPELSGEPPLEPVAEEDRAAIEAALEPTPGPGTGPAPVAVSAAAIDAGHHGDAAGEGTYRARIELAGPLDPFRAREVRSVDVVVQNAGDRTWPARASGLLELSLSYRFAPGHEGLRTPLPEPVPPGAETRVPVVVAAPDEPGRHRLSIDVVHEHVRWFGEPLELEVEVLPAPRVAIAGEDEELQRLAAERVTALRPELEPVLLVRDPGSAHARLGYAAAPSAHDEVLRAGTATSLRRAATYAFKDAALPAELLLVVGRPERRREKLVETATVAAARRRGIPIAYARDAGELENVVRSLPTGAAPP